MLARLQPLHETRNYGTVRIRQEEEQEGSRKPAVEPVDEDKVAAAEANAAAKAESAETVLAEPASEYQGRGEERGPWDVDDEDVPDYDDYLDLGAYYLPFLRGIQLRIKANRATQQVLGSTITFGSSSAGDRSLCRAQDPGTVG